MRRDGLGYSQFKNSLLISHGLSLDCWSPPHHLPDAVAAIGAACCKYCLGLDLDRVTTSAIPEFLFGWDG